MAEYECTIPIAGHAFVTVDADREEEAIQKALESVTMDDIQEWEPMEQFGSVNVLYCPQPWGAEATKVSDD